MVEDTVQCKQGSERAELSSKYLLHATKSLILASFAPLSSTDLNLHFFLYICDEWTYVNDSTTRIVNSEASSYVCPPSAAVYGLSGAWARMQVPVSADLAFLHMRGKYEHPSTEVRKCSWLMQISSHSLTAC